MNTRRRAAIFTVSLLVLQLQSEPADAIRQPGHLKAKPALEVATGQRVRITTMVDYHRVPKSAVRAFTAFLFDLGFDWWASWDRATAVPSRLYGKGFKVPGSVKNAAVAEQYARSLLTRHIALLAPGASASDFLLVTNHLSRRGVRTVGFHQYYMGLRVLGGQVSFRFKNDRMFVIGSEAVPQVSARAGAPSISEATARSAAIAWLTPDAAAVKAIRADGPMVLPLIGDRRVLSMHTVMRVKLATERPIGRWNVYVDAHSGQVVAREQTLRFASATVRYDVPERRPGSTRLDLPARNTGHLLNGASAPSDDAGAVTWAGGQAQLTARLTAPQVRLINDAGAEAEHSVTINDSDQVRWSLASDVQGDAQLTTFIHARLIKDFVRTLAGDQPWLDAQVPATVNISDGDCNAFASEDSINFFVASNQCENTGRLPDVIYHEYGHVMHGNALLPGAGGFDGGFSEGLSDYLAGTYVDDSGMGRGFFRSDAALRDMDPLDREYVWPDDVGEMHDTGRIFAGAMWDLRKELIDKHGKAAGVALADALFYAAVQRSGNIPATYVEILAEDDDDGDLSNGTPNECEINVAFGRHGLRSVTAEIMTPLSVQAPTQDGYHVALQVSGLTGNCPGDSITAARLDWKLREDSSTNGSLTLTEDAGIYSADIPQQPAGKVVQYQIVLQLADGSARAFPDNPGDPWYEFFVGEVVELYCTNFDSTDPFANGWSHELVSGDPREGADDWTWGAPINTDGSAGSGDPGAAFSGDNVIGNDLGGDNYNGQYQPNKVNAARSPVIDVKNYTDVRLQYWRWLNVEDSYFDKATIYANDQMMWRNFNSDMGNSSSTHHTDKEWRFHDVPLSAAITDGTVQVSFEIDSDGGLEMGGWTIDDFCVVAFTGSVCGDGMITGAETCDDGAANSDSAADACRSNCLVASCGDGVVDSGESCDDGNDIDDDECDNTCGAADGGGEGGCGCKASRTPDPGALLLLAMCLVGLFARRRRWALRSDPRRC